MEQRWSWGGAGEQLEALETTATVCSPCCHLTTYTAVSAAKPPDYTAASLWHCVLWVTSAWLWHFTSVPEQKFLKCSWATWRMMFYRRHNLISWSLYGDICPAWKRPHVEAWIEHVALLSVWHPARTQASAASFNDFNKLYYYCCWV